MSATRADIRTRARLRADQDSSTFPTDDQYNLLINEALQDVWWDLHMAGFPWSPSTDTITLTAGSANVSIPTSGEIAGVRGVFYKSGSTYRELHRLPEDRRAEVMSSPQGEPLYYELHRATAGGGTTVSLYPTPSGGQLYVESYEIPLAMVSDGSSWYGPARSDELLVLRTAWKAMRKEGNDQGANFLLQEYQELLEKTVRMASWFDQRGSSVIRDVNPLRPTRDPFDFDI